MELATSAWRLVERDKRRHPDAEPKRGDFHIEPFRLARRRAGSATTEAGIGRPQVAPHQPYSDIVVVEFETLSGSTKQEVEDVIQDTSADDLRELQHIIGQSRQALLTLAAAGMNLNQVVAAGVTLDGVLTLVVQETA
jgi:hypothetical protein